MRALELFRRLEAIPELPRWDGATVDFHKERPAAVFIPQEPPIIAVIENGELPGFLFSHGVRKVLVDALWPGNVGVLKELLEGGVEVWVLTRASALHGWWKNGNKGKPKGLVEWLLRHHPEVLKGFKGEVKNDVYDAVLLRYVARKYIKRVMREFLTCWPRMLLFRHVLMEHQRLQNQISALPIPEQEKEEEIRRSEERVKEKARAFVDTMRQFYPVDGLFRELEISNDNLIAQAYCCEVFMEIDPERSVYRERNHFGIKWRSDRNVKLIRDGRALHALNQLTAKVMGVNPAIAKKGFREAMWEVLKKIHTFKREIMGLRPAPRRGTPGHGLFTLFLTTPAARR